LEGKGVAAVASPSRSEGDRLVALHRYELLDTADEAAFDRIVELAASMFDVPIALVSLMDADRQWFKARCGIAATGTPRDVAFCRFTILTDEVMVVPDARLDPRFAGNPLVTGEPWIRFYAGAPLHTADGFNIGTICLIDTRPRHRFDRADRQRLADLAGITMELIEARLRGLHPELHAAAAAAEHQRLLDAIEAVPAAFSLFDREDRLCLFNRRYEEMFWGGMEDQLALGLTFEELLHRRARGGAVEIEGRTEDWVEQRLAYRRRGGGTLELRLPDGRWTRAFERRTADGGVIAVNVDITERKERERALENTSRVLRSTLDSISQAVSAFDAELRLVAWNDRFIELLGFPAEFAQVGRSFADFIRYKAERGEYGPGDPEELTASRVALAAAPEPYEAEWLRSDGRVLEVRGNPTQGGGFVRSYQDITRRKQREEQLSRALALQYAILNSTTATIVAAEIDGTISIFNPAAERLLGFARDEMVGRASIVALHDPDELGQRAVRMGQRLGRPVQPGLEVLVGELSGGQASEGEWTYVRADGGRVPMFLSIDGLCSQAGDLIGFLAVGTDISELKKIERMKSEFVSTVSHELRTPLTSIKGSLGLLLCGLAGSLPDRARQMVEIAASNTDRLVRLINDILDIEKIESGRMSFRRDVLKLGVLLAEAVEQNEAYADQYGVRLELAALTAPVQVEGDRDRLLQVMANLLSNAIKFSPRDETVRVEVAVREGRVRIAVVDRGPGIPPEFHAQIFQKFAQADASDSRQRGGTGLGLSICKAIVERLDGTIGFESEPGEGSTFYVELPLVPAPGERRSGSAGSLLVCEDDPASGRLLETILRSAPRASGSTLRAISGRSGNALRRPATTR
jgi:PAS domain S-box-containing protein